jgi:hypothetical protein
MLTRFAAAMPEFPRAKPGSFQASFDRFEDQLEAALGVTGRGGKPLA